jgi:hypothetical protein
MLNIIYVMWFHGECAVVDLGIQSEWRTETNRVVLCGQVILLTPILVVKTLTRRMFDIHDLLIFK